MEIMFFAVVTMLNMYGTEGMSQVPQSFDDKSVFFTSVGVQVVINQATVDRVLDDSNVLYISIDDFLDNNYKCKNEKEYFQFISECMDLVSRFSEYQDILIQKIIPQFEKFATEDAPCEVAGLYDDAKVIDFVKYLNKRLISLKALIGR